MSLVAVNLLGLVVSFRWARAIRPSFGSVLPRVARVVLAAGEVQGRQVCQPRRVLRRDHLVSALDPFVEPEDLNILLEIILIK